MDGDLPVTRIMARCSIGSIAMHYKPSPEFLRSRRVLVVSGKSIPVKGNPVNNLLILADVNYPG